MYIFVLTSVLVENSQSTDKFIVRCCTVPPLRPHTTVTRPMFKTIHTGLSDNISFISYIVVGRIEVQHHLSFKLLKKWLFSLEQSICTVLALYILQGQVVVWVNLCTKKKKVINYILGFQTPDYKNSYLSTTFVEAASPCNRTTRPDR